MKVLSVNALLIFSFLCIPHFTDAMKRGSDRETEESGNNKKQKTRGNPLIQAIKKDEHQEIQKYLNDDKLIDKCDSKKFMPIHYAVSQGKTELVKQIIDRLKALNKKLKQNVQMDLMSIACAKGYAEILSYVVVDQRTAKFVGAAESTIQHFLGSHTIYPFQAALISRNPEVVKILSQNHWRPYCAGRRYFQYSDLKMAIEDRADAFIDALVECDIIYLDEAFILAVLENKLEKVIDRLVKIATTSTQERAGEINKSDMPPEAKLRLPHTLLFAAVYKKNQKMVEAVSSCISNQKEKDQIMLIGAIFAHDATLVKLILERKTVMLNEQIKLFCPHQIMTVLQIPTGNFTPLVYAILANDIHLVKMLLECGAELKDLFVWNNARIFLLNSHEVNALTVAILLGHKEIANFLITKGACIEESNALNIAFKELNAQFLAYALDYEIPLPATIPNGQETEKMKNIISQAFTKRHSKFCEAAASGDLETLTKMSTLDPACDFTRPFQVEANKVVEPLVNAVIAGKQDAIEFLLKCIFEKNSELTKIRSLLHKPFEFILANKDLISFESFIKVVKSSEHAAQLLWALGYFAVRKGAKAFLERIVKEEVLDHKFAQNALIEASSQGHEECVLFLLGLNPDLTYLCGYKDNAAYGKTALDAASTPGIASLISQAMNNQAGSLTKALEALGKGEQLTKEQQSLVNNRDASGKTLLIQCLQQRNLKAVEQLIAYQANALQKDTKGHAPLFYAVATGDKRFVEALCKAASYKNVLEDCKEAIYAAAAHGLVPIIQHLLDDASEEQSDLLSAAMGGAVNNDQIDVVKFLIQRKINVDAPAQNAPGLYKDVPLDLATSKAMVQLLISAGASISNGNKVPWLIALTKCRFQLVPLLLSWDLLPGAGTMIPTPLAHRVCELAQGCNAGDVHLYLDAVESVTLLESLKELAWLKDYLKDQDTFAQDYLNKLENYYKTLNHEKPAESAVTPKQEKQTLLMIACIFGHRTIVEKMISKALPEEYINKQDKHGRTALMYALLYGNVDCALLLVHHECKITTPEGESKIVYVNHCGNGINLNDTKNRTALFYSVYAARGDHQAEEIDNGKLVVLSKNKYSIQYGALKVIMQLRKLGAKFGDAKDIALVAKIAAIDDPTNILAAEMIRCFNQQADLEKVRKIKVVL